MKSTELRIGNLVRYTGLGGDINAPVEVYTLSPGFISTNGKLSLPEKRFEGIPASEGWLIRMGFYLNKQSTYKKQYDHVTFSQIGYDWDLATGWWFRFNGSYIDIQHVHSLQNIFFALTGEELTITP